MLFLRTGLPGSGKTLNTIKDVDLEHQADPENPNLRLYKDPQHPDLPPRTIYYNGIPDLKVDKLKSKWVEWDTPDKWFELPDGAVIVIDEAQGTFGTDVRTRVEKVTRFEKHRHHGWDVHIITQHPSLICSPVRKLVGKHINFIRPFGRTKRVFRHEYEMCIDSPERRSNFKMAQETKIDFDPHYYGLYKSATVHTHKKVTPSYVKLIPLLILAVVIPLALLGWGFYHIVSGAKSEKQKREEVTAVAAPAEGHKSNLVPSADSGKVLNTTEYLQQYKPRIADVQSSAPRYDAVDKPRDFPRPTCLFSTDPRLVSRAKSDGQAVGNYQGQATACQCYSQQVTRIKTSLEFCMDVAKNGYFDDTKQQPAYASGTTRGLSSKKTEDPADALRRVPAAVTQEPVTSHGNGLTVISDSEYASRPWR